jgi:hypothetical protein
MRCQDQRLFLWVRPITFGTNPIHSWTARGLATWGRPLPMAAPLVLTVEDAQRPKTNSQSTALVW